MDQNWLLSPEKKKESIKNLLSYLGIFAAVATVLVFSALFFTDVSFSAEGSVSFSLSFLLLFISSYMMYVSLFETGKGQGEREPSFVSLSTKRAELFARLYAEGDTESLTAFCRAKSDRETKEARENILRLHFTTEAEAEAWKKLPKRSLTAEHRRVLRALAAQKAVVLTPRALLSEQPHASRSAPLSVSPDKKRRRRTLSFLLPLAIFTALSVSVACEVILNPSADIVVGYLLKLFTLLQSGIKGFRSGFFYITADKCDYMKEQCDLLTEYLKERKADKDASLPASEDILLREKGEQLSL